MSLYCAEVLLLLLPGQSILKSLLIPPSHCDVGVQALYNCTAIQGISVCSKKATAKCLQNVLYIKSLESHLNFLASDDTQRGDLPSAKICLKMLLSKWKKEQFQRYMSHPPNKVYEATTFYALNQLSPMWHPPVVQTTNPISPIQHRHWLWLMGAVVPNFWKGCMQVLH